MTSCSKAPWGLSVLSRVTRIFTSTTISPGPPSRQRPSRYAFRAGRNLPDKEFRYLRTVIVTAAVYWGLSSELRIFSQPFPLTFQHRAGVSSYTSSFDLAETCVFGKQSLGPLLCGLSALLLPKLRSLFAEFLNEGSPARLWILSSPTCVGLWYGHLILDSNFSWQPLRNFALRLPITALMSFGTSLKALFVAAWTCSTNRTLFLSRCVLASLLADFGGTGFITGSPSPTLSPRLRSRLTLGGLSFPRNP